MKYTERRLNDCNVHGYSRLQLCAQVGRDERVCEQRARRRPLVLRLAKALPDEVAQRLYEGRAAITFRPFSFLG